MKRCRMFLTRWMVNGRNNFILKLFPLHLGSLRVAQGFEGKPIATGGGFYFESKKKAWPHICIE
jgi:hypothetical protein